MHSYEWILVIIIGIVWIVPVIMDANKVRRYYVEKKIQIKRAKKIKKLRKRKKLKNEKK